MIILRQKYNTRVTPLCALHFLDSQQQLLFEKSFCKAYNIIYYFSIVIPNLFQRDIGYTRII